ncbi:MAG TPA: aminotransferase class III-fold pyridoxal phosphate-dependent enzyme [Ilumatobacteraceae bacterium]|nr:aminotransferase class III-fold pyridoxal phosphate-dependent enzyme [Ilumatobacteraceae bacterium]
MTSHSAGNTQDAFFPSAFAASMPTIVSGHGEVLLDDRGRELIDVCSGPFLAALGQGNERVLAAMLQQGRQLSYVYSRMTRHPANAALSGRLAAMAGPGFERVHLTSGGSEANEMAIKMLRMRAIARAERDRTRVITLMPGYHGATVNTLGYNGDESVGATWGAMTVEAARIPAPLTYRAPSAEHAAQTSLAALDQLLAEIGPERVLAIMVEPIGGQASGVNVPHPSFLRGLRQVCDRTGIALVFDEIVTALRTGAFLAAHHDPTALPDIVTMAKGLGAGYAPLGAVLTSAALADELAATVGFVVSHSYDASPIACAAGEAVLAEIQDRGLVQRAAELGDHLRAGLNHLAAQHEIIGDVRGRGLLQAIELVADRATGESFPADVDPAQQIASAALDHGLLLYSRRQNGGRYGDWLLFAPPLIVDEAVIDTIVERLDAVLRAVTPSLRGR